MLQQRRPLVASARARSVEKVVNADGGRMCRSSRHKQQLFCAYGATSGDHQHPRQQAHALRPPLRQVFGARDGNLAGADQPAPMPIARCDRRGGWSCTSAKWNTDRCNQFP